MMKWLDRLERKCKGRCIPHLMRDVIIGQVVVWFLVMLVDSRIYNLLTLTRAGLLAGQIWRLVTFVLLPPLTGQILFLALELYLVYMIGTALENEWGDFYFNVYFLVGMLGAVIAALLTGSAGNSALELSLFFAFACLYPNQEFILFFILPVKVKWLGWIGAAYYAFLFLRGGWDVKISLACGLAAFLVFFGPYLVGTARSWYTNQKRRRQWNDQWKR